MSDSDFVVPENPEAKVKENEKLVKLPSLAKELTEL